MVICGLDVAEAVFFHLDEESPELESKFNDGDEVEAGTVFATMRGFADVLLTGERVALNLDAENVGRGDADTEIC